MGCWLLVVGPGLVQPESRHGVLGAGGPAAHLASRSPRPGPRRGPLYDVSTLGLGVDASRRPRVLIVGSADLALAIPDGGYCCVVNWHQPLNPPLNQPLNFTSNHNPRTKETITWESTSLKVLLRFTAATFNCVMRIRDLQQLHRLTSPTIGPPGSSLLWYATIILSLSRSSVSIFVWIGYLLAV